MRWLASIVVFVTAPADDWLSPQWTGSPACVQTHALAGRVRELVGDDVQPTATSLQLEATATDGGWTIDVHVRSGASDVRRRLEGDDCETLTAAVALVTAVHLDAVAVASTTIVPLQSATLPAPPAATTPPSTTSAPAPSPAPAPPRLVDGRDEPSPPSPPPRVPPRALLSAGIAAELGIVPRAGATFELAAGVRWRRASVEVGGLATLGPDAPPPSSDAIGGARVRLFSGTARGCGVLARDRIEVPMCGALELGDLFVAPTGDLPQASSVHALWVAATAGVRPQWVVSRRVALGGIVDLVVPLRRHRFFTDEGTVHAVSPLAARLGLGVRVQLP